MTFFRLLIYDTLSGVCERNDDQHPKCLHNYSLHYFFPIHKKEKIDRPVKNFMLE
jgi:hypothetical protein